MTPASPRTATFSVGDRVRFVSVQERAGQTATPDRLTAAYVGTVLEVLGYLDRPAEYLIEFDAPPVRGIRSRRATYPADALVPWHL
jgi:hypothetical protein